MAETRTWSAFLNRPTLQTFNQTSFEIRARHNQIWVKTILHVVTLLGRVTHTCLSDLNIIGSDNVLSPGRHRDIVWTNAGILLIRPLFSLKNAFEKVACKLAFISYRSQCVKKTLYGNIDGNWTWLILCLQMSSHLTVPGHQQVQCGLQDCIRLRFHWLNVIFNKHTGGTRPQRNRSCSYHRSRLCHTNTSLVKSHVVISSEIISIYYGNYLSLFVKFAHDINLMSE